MQRFIVAEISKNWRAGEELFETGLLCQQFEAVIQHNLERGYQLHSFQVDRVIEGPDVMNELIIAVFERIDHA